MIRPERIGGTYSDMSIMIGQDADVLCLAFTELSEIEQISSFFQEYATYLFHRARWKNEHAGIISPQQLAFEDINTLLKNFSSHTNDMRTDGELERYGVWAKFLHGIKKKVKPQIADWNIVKIPVKEVADSPYL